MTSTITSLSITALTAGQLTPGGASMMTSPPVAASICIQSGLYPAHQGRAHGLADPQPPGEKTHVSGFPPATSPSSRWPGEIAFSGHTAMQPPQP